MLKAVNITRKWSKTVTTDKVYDVGYTYVSIMEEIGTAPIIAIRGRRRGVIGTPNVSLGL